MSYARQRKHHRVAAKEAMQKPIIEANVMTGKNNQKMIFVLLIMFAVSFALQIALLVKDLVSAE